MDESRTNPPDVTIIGAGIIGTCTALAALERGLSVEVIDAGAPGDATSYGNGGVISPWSIIPQCLPGVWKSVPGWMLDPLGPVRVRFRDIPRILPWAFQFLKNTQPERATAISRVMKDLLEDNIPRYRHYLRDTGKDDLLQDSWYVNVFRGHELPDLENFNWKLRLDQGAPLETVDAAGLREVEPDISEEYGCAILIKDQARAVDPGRLCKVLLEKAQQDGAVYTRSDVRTITPQANGGFRLQTDTRPLHVNKLVLAAGVRSSALLEPFGFKIPLMVERGYHMEFANPGVRLNNSIMDLSAKCVVSSMSGGVRIVGISEFASIDAPPNYRRATVFPTLAKRLLPGLNTAEANDWMGIRPSFPDNLPAIGPISGVPNLFAAFGHSHYGMSMAPGTAELVADLLVDKPASLDLSVFDINRFN